MTKCLPSAQRDFRRANSIPLFLLTAAFFDRWMDFWRLDSGAWGSNAITFNRIGKERHTLVFFMLFAFYFYLRAKQTDSRKVKVRIETTCLAALLSG